VPVTFSKFASNFKVSVQFSCLRTSHAHKQWWLNNHDGAYCMRGPAGAVSLIESFNREAVAKALVAFTEALDQALQLPVDDTVLDQVGACWLLHFKFKF
jgi:hypothetical protein